jgi:hypothetical protein
MDPSRESERSRDKATRSNRFKPQRSRTDQTDLFLKPYETGVDTSSSFQWCPLEPMLKHLDALDGIRDDMRSAVSGSLSLVRRTTGYLVKCRGSVMTMKIDLPNDPDNTS